MPEVMTDERLAELERLREEIKVFVAENIELRDWQQGRLVDERKRDERVRQAALDSARSRCRDLAVHALSSLRDPLRHLAKQLVETEGLNAVGQRAYGLLQELEREPAPDSVERVVADMQAAHDRLIAEKAAMWNCLLRHGLTPEIGEAAS